MNSEYVLQVLLIITLICISYNICYREHSQPCHVNTKRYVTRWTFIRWTSRRPLCVPSFRLFSLVKSPRVATFSVSCTSISSSPSVCVCFRVVATIVSLQQECTSSHWSVSSSIVIVCPVLFDQQFDSRLESAIKKTRHKDTFVALLIRNGDNPLLPIANTSCHKITAAVRWILAFRCDDLMSVFSRKSNKQSRKNCMSLRKSTLHTHKKRRGCRWEKHAHTQKGVRCVT